jgi:hypothetical protein
MSWPSHARFEAHAVATLARGELTPRAALTALGAAAERLRGWTPRDGPFDDFAAGVIDAAAPLRLPVPDAPLEAALEGWERAAAAIPAGQAHPASPRRELEAFGIARADTLVDEGWDRLRRPVCRWLAARAFASWLALQGDGVRTTVLGLRVALGVLRAEAARGCAEGGGLALDDAILKQAVRRADLLLHHLVDVEALARQLSRCEAS